ncbi:hypothetical protein DE146DRAFT_663129 [Phaeosphaeria sp. MPI-PUGE-AT-0046c]|nr:hypothetical protein DE146DRAFT_663129 [Phaeosphaeria sp. MPI-PUGE-AT-0046c]
MLNGDPLEAGSCSLHLKDVNVEAFRRFYSWLNTGSFDCTEGDTAICTHKLWVNAVNVYIFADYHQIQDLKNAVMNLLFLNTGKLKKIPPVISSSIYPNTTKEDPLRRFVVDITSSIYTFENFDKSKAEDYDREFLFDVLCTVQHKVLGFRCLTALGDEWNELEGHMIETRIFFCMRYHQHLL